VIIASRYQHKEAAHALIQELTAEFSQLMER